MNKVKKFDISIFLIYLSLVFGYYFTQGIPIFEFSQDPERLLEIQEMVPLFFITIIPGIIYFSLKIRLKETLTKFDKMIIVLLGIIFLNNLIANLILPNGISTYPFNQFEDKELITFDYSLGTKAISILSCFVTLLDAYFLICELPKKFYNERRISAWLIHFLIATLLVITYSIIVDYEIYWNDLTLKEYAPVYVLFIDLRSYAVLLIYMMFVCLYLNNKKPNILYYLLAIFLYLNIFCNGSKVCLFMGAVMLSGYTVFRLIYTYRNHKTRNIIVGSCLAILTIVLLVLLYKHKDVEGTLLYRVVQQFKTLEESSVSSNQSRVKIWDASIELMKNSNWFTGFGFVNYGRILRAYLKGINDGGWSTDLAHNMFIQTTGTGGIIFFLIYLFIFFCLIKMMIKIARKHVPLVVLTSLFLVLYLAHYYSDSAIAFFYNCIPHCDAIFLTLTLYLPVASIYYKENYPQEGQLIKEEAVRKLEEKILKFDILKWSTLIIGCLSSSTIYFVFQMQNHECNNVIKAILISFLAFYVIGLVAIFATTEKKKSEVLIKEILPQIIVFAASYLSTILIDKITHFDSLMYHAYVIAFGASIYSLLFALIPYFRNSISFYSKTIVILNNIRVKDDAKYY